MANIFDLVAPPGKRRKLRGSFYDRRHWRAPSDPVWSESRRGRRPSWAEFRLVLLAGALIGLTLAEFGGAASVIPRSSETTAMSFGLCDTKRSANCVIDGDTFRMNGEKIRLADIDTPETHPPRCAHEAELGERATLRLRTLLNAGPFALEPIGRDEDRYGRKLRIAVRDGQSIGGALVAEGLARPYAGGRRSWWF